MKKQNTKKTQKTTKSLAKSQKETTRKIHHSSIKNNTIVQNATKKALNELKQLEKKAELYIYTRGAQGERIEKVMHDFAKYTSLSLEAKPKRNQVIIRDAQGKKLGELFYRKHLLEIYYRDPSKALKTLKMATFKTNPNYDLKTWAILPLSDTTLQAIADTF